MEDLLTFNRNEITIREKTQNTQVNYLGRLSFRIFKSTISKDLEIIDKEKFNSDSLIKIPTNLNIDKDLYFWLKTYLGSRFEINHLNWSNLGIWEDDINPYLIYISHKNNWPGVFLIPEPVSAYLKNWIVNHLITINTKLNNASNHKDITKIMLESIDNVNKRLKNYKNISSVSENEIFKLVLIFDEFYSTFKELNDTLIKSEYTKENEYKQFVNNNNRSNCNNIKIIEKHKNFYDDKFLENKFLTHDKAYKISFNKYNRSDIKRIKISDYFSEDKLIDNIYLLYFKDYLRDLRFYERNIYLPDIKNFVDANIQWIRNSIKDIDNIFSLQIAILEKYTCAIDYIRNIKDVNDDIREKYLWFTINFYEGLLQFLEDENYNNPFIIHSKISKINNPLTSKIISSIANRIPNKIVKWVSPNFKNLSTKETNELYIYLKAQEVRDILGQTTVEFTDKLWDNLFGLIPLRNKIKEIWADSINNTNLKNSNDILDITKIENNKQTTTRKFITGRRKKSKNSSDTLNLQNKNVKKIAINNKFKSLIDINNVFNLFKNLLIVILLQLLWIGYIYNNANEENKQDLKTKFLYISTVILIVVLIYKILL